MVDTLNKNISVWRGNNAPPTDYHLWLDDNNLKIKKDGEWGILGSGAELVECENWEDYILESNPKYSVDLKTLLDYINGEQ